MSRTWARIIAVPAFVLLYLLITVAWKVPCQVGIGLLLLSGVCFLAYCADKLAARAGGWRIRESTLLWLGLLGGWPGALLAQQWLRHKSSKPAFLRAFWLTVIVNTAVFVMLSSPGIAAWKLLR